MLLAIPPWCTRSIEMTFSGLNTQNSVSGVIVLMAFMMAFSGCGVGHIGEYVPKRRQYKSPVSFDEKKISYEVTKK